MQRSIYASGPPDVGGAGLPSRTQLPFEAPGKGVTVVVDDENVRLTGELDLGGRVVDYAALAERCAAGFGTADVHVFAARPLVIEQPSGSTAARITVHPKQAPGKNADIEATIWLVLALHHRPPPNLLLVTGDIDFVALYQYASGLQVNTGFLAPPARSTAGILRKLPFGLLGADVLRQPQPQPRLRRAAGGRLPQLGAGTCANTPEPLSHRTIYRRSNR